MLAQKTKHGFTLIEMLIALSLVVVVGAGILDLQYFISQIQLVSTKNYLNTNQANSNLSALSRELRTARVSDIGTYPIELAEDNQLIFYSDIDFDSQAERLRYSLVGTNMERGVVEPTGQPTSYPLENEKTKILTDNVRNGTTPLFTYYNGDWPEDIVNNPLPTPANLATIKLIKIHLRINTEIDDPESDYLLESFAQIRTLKNNLDY